MSSALALLGALVLDDRLGEPPPAVHPVRLMGRAIEAAEARAPEAAPARLRYGAVLAGALPLGAAATTWTLSRLAHRGHRVAGLALDAALLSSTLARRSLLERAREVATALEAGDLEDARARLGRHLVSRNPSALEVHEVAAATIESVAENLSDGFTGPIVAYVLGGAPAASAYRMANTLDSMWGYRYEPYAELGRHPARLDDAVNLVPSRITALAIVAAAAITEGPAAARQAFDTWIDEGDATQSPNAGQPMAAMAEALGVRLEKRDTYALGLSFPPPHTEDIARAVWLADRASMLLAAGALAAIALRARLADLEGVTARQLLVTAGATAAIHLVAHVSLKAGSRALIFGPAFGEYEAAARAAGAHIEPRPFASLERGEVGLGDAGSAPLVLVCNPNNPTGGYLEQATVERLAAAVAVTGGTLLLDVAYDPFVEAAWDAEDLGRAGAPVLVVHSLTKLHAVPGIRLGYVTGSEESIARLEAQQPSWSVSAQAIAAGLAAAGVDRTQRTAALEVGAVRAGLATALREAGIEVNEGRANFLLAQVGDAAAFRKRLLWGGFAVRDCASFGLDGWVRVAVPPAGALGRLATAFVAALEAGANG